MSSSGSCSLKKGCIPAPAGGQSSDVHIEAGGRDALRALGGLFTFLQTAASGAERGCLRGQRAHMCTQRPACLQGFLQCKKPSGPSHLPIPLLPGVPGRKAPSPHGPQGRQHVMPGTGGSNLLIPGASVVSAPLLLGA